MPHFAKEFTELCGRIAETERRVELQHDKLARWPTGSDDALYARVLVRVLERSLALMYTRRDRLERELRALRRAETRRRPAGQTAPGPARASVPPATG